jgi:hypothetical protein
MAARLSALRDVRALPIGRFLVLISVTGWVDPRAIVRLEGLGQLKNPMTSLGIESATCRLVAQCLNQHRYPVPPIFMGWKVKGPLVCHFTALSVLHSTASNGRMTDERWIGEDLNESFRNLTHHDRIYLEELTKIIKHARSSIFWGVTPYRRLKPTFRTNMSLTSSLIKKPARSK